MSAAAELREQMEFGADPTRLSPVGRSKRERDHLSTLERRIEHLDDLDGRGQANNWDKAERAALRWALARIAEAERGEQTDGS